jgi:mannose-6-phosphate isomerase-like protein (cupin superfamily)
MLSLVQCSFFIMSGEGTIIINGEPFPVRAGDVVLSFAFQLHWHHAQQSRTIEHTI